MELDHRKYEEVIEAELLEFTGEAMLHEPMQFARIRTMDGRLMEVVVEADMSPTPKELFRAFAHASTFRPDHSERNILANEPSAPWLENIEILPRPRGAAWRMVGKRGTVAAIDDIEATDIISLLELRGVSEVDAHNGSIRIKAGEKSTISVGYGSMSLAGDATNDPRPVRAILDYARANWEGECAVHGSERFKLQVWAHAQLIGVCLPNFSLPSQQETHVDDIMSGARIAYRWMSQIPTPALATRRILLRAARKPSIP